MTKCKCDGCGWQGDESEVEDIDLNEWASYSDFDAITCLPVGECACGAPVYTLAADKAWALAKAAPELLEELKKLALTYVHFRQEHEPGFKPFIHSRSLKRINALISRIEGLE